MKLYNPSPELVYKSEEIYFDTLHKSRFNVWLNKNKTRDILVQRFLWPLDGEKKIKKLEDDIDELKVQLYKAVLSVDYQEQIRKMLKITRIQYGRMLNIKHSLDNATIEGYAEQVAKEWLFANTIYINDILVRDIGINGFLFNYIVKKFTEQICDISAIRLIARTNPWRNIWSIHKEKVFDTPLSDEQNSLIIHSQMYDSIYSHPECPADNVIGDDDMLDGWMINEKRERDKERKDKGVDELSQIVSKHGDAEEIFVPIKSPKDGARTSPKEQVKHVHSLNTPVNRAIKRSREKIIHQKGTASDLNFPDVKQELEMQRNQAYRDRMKGLKNG